MQPPQCITDNNCWPKGDCGFHCSSMQDLSPCKLYQALFPQLIFLVFCLLMQVLCFTVAGEGLTSRLRSRAFKAILRQEIGWFDHDRNSSGALTTRLANDAAQVQGVRRYLTSHGLNLARALCSRGSTYIGFCLVCVCVCVCVCVREGEKTCHSLQKKLMQVHVYIIQKLT